MNTILTWGLALIFFTYISLSVLMWYLTPPFREDIKGAVVVLGDIAHSPRMCNHALSIANVGRPVDLIGYVQSELREDLLNNPLITIKKLPDPIKRGSTPYLLYGIKRAIKEHLTLYETIKASNPTVLMVQNPPSIPTLGVARLMTIFSIPGCKLVIDWHNLGYTILGLNPASNKWLVRFYKFYEMLFGRVAYLHLCVSVKLGMALKSRFAINPKRTIPLPDRPFKSHLVNKMPVRRSLNLGDVNDCWVVTSTSFTPDEDVYMLLNALEKYNGSKRINLIVTGKGPGREKFEDVIRTKKFLNASVRTAWLSYENYFDLLAACDLGVSMHKSSSGWDLPMKVVDMFSCGLPVLSFDYPAITELVKPEKNGLLFSSENELSSRLNVVDDDLKLGKLRRGAEAEATNTWTEMWNLKVGPVFGYGRYTGIESSSDSD